MMMILMVVNTFDLVQFIYVLAIIVVNDVINDHPYKGSVGSP